MGPRPATASAPTQAQRRAQQDAAALVEVDEGVEQPVTARAEATRLIGALLHDPVTAARLHDSGVRFVVMPRSTKASELPQLAHSHDVAELRGVVDEEHRIVVIPEENLLGEATTALGGERHYADGYSVVTHETAHAVYLF
ncbi:hypothetical protein, partial [Streptomyces humidus]|uniref:hypothetical protein n=1 Tax=Streptomyces humidus TaxID=52259 RepID=UPI00167DB969